MDVDTLGRLLQRTGISGAAYSTRREHSQKKCKLLFLELRASSRASLRNGFTGNSMFRCSNGRRATGPSRSARMQWKRWRATWAIKRNTIAPKPFRKNTSSCWNEPGLSMKRNICGDHATLRGAGIPEFVVRWVRSLGLASHRLPSSVPPGRAAARAR